MPAPKRPEFRRRAVELARLCEKPIREIARDFGIAESGLRRWMKQADADEGKTDAITWMSVQRWSSCAATSWSSRWRSGSLKRACAYFSGEHPPKVIFLVVQELAADGVPVTDGHRRVNAELVLG